MQQVVLIRLLWLLTSLLPLLAHAQTPTFDMAVRVLAPTNPPGGRPYAHDVAVDAAGNSYVSGALTGSVRFGTGTLITGGADLYVAKIDPAGAYRWIVLITSGSATANHLTRLAVDAGGNVWVAGDFTNATLTLGATTLPNAGGSDVFVGKLNSNGNWLSATRAGGPGNDVVSDLALDRSGNAYLAGLFTATTGFGSTQLRSAGGADFYLARLSTANTWDWAISGGSSADDWSTAVGLDASGHVYLTGRVEAPGQLMTVALPASRNFIVRLAAATGTVQRLTTIGGAASYYYATLAVSAAGDCYLAGAYLGTIQLGRFALTSVGVGFSNEDVFVAKLSAAGDWEWASTAGGPSGEHCTGIAVDELGNVYLTGNFRGPGTRFGPTLLVPQNPALFFDEVFVAKLDALGNWRWAVPAGGTQADFSVSLALGPFATPYITGEYFSPTMSFGPLTTPGEPVLAASTFVARMQPNLLTIVGDSVLCNGGATQLSARTLATTASYRWNTGATTATINASQPGLYTVTVTMAGGYTLTQQFRVRVVSPAPNVQITGGGSQLCPGTPRQLTAVAPGATGFRWQTGATTPSITVTQPGTYSVIASYGAACTTSAQVTLANSELRISGRGQLCPGQSTTLTAVATGSAATAYQWNTGATTATLVVGQAGTYRVVVTLADGCRLTATHVVGPPVAQIASINGDTLLCAGSTLALTAQNPDAISYRWNTGATTPTISIEQPGLYKAVLTYAGGCTSSDSLAVLAAPIAPKFVLGRDTTLCLEQPLLLHAPPLSGPGVVRRWSDGSSGPTLLVSEAGTYSLQLTTPCGSQTATQQVAYVSCLVIPNIITPNGDQQNDLFRLPGLTRGEWALTLYNRWGRQVYDTAAYQQDWGAEAPAGIYYYLLRQGAVRYKGWVEVKR